MTQGRAMRGYMQKNILVALLAVVLGASQAIDVRGQVSVPGIDKPVVASLVGAAAVALAAAGFAAAVREREFPRGCCGAGRWGWR